MGKIEWAMWANEQAVVSGVCMLMGGIIGVAGLFKNWQFSVCVIIESVFILLLEWPRSKRARGHTIERKFQIHLTKLLDKMTPFSSNYYIRFIIHILFSIPSCFLLPTIMGGLALMLASFIYLVAAVKGEEWKPVGIESRESEAPGPSTSSGLPPDRPPPRRPPVDGATGPVAETSFELNRI